MHLRLVRSAGESGEQGQSRSRRQWSSVAVYEVEGRSVTALWLSWVKLYGCLSEEVGRRWGPLAFATRD
jgi:hypothetical protein